MLRSKTEKAQRFRLMIHGGPKSKWRGFVCYSARFARNQLGCIRIDLPLRLHVDPWNYWGPKLGRASSWELNLDSDSRFLWVVWNCFSSFLATDFCNFNSNSKSERAKIANFSPIQILSLLAQQGQRRRETLSRILKYFDPTLRPNNWLWVSDQWSLQLEFIICGSEVLLRIRSMAFLRYVCLYLSLWLICSSQRHRPTKQRKPQGKWKGSCWIQAMAMTIESEQTQVQRQA